MKDTSDSGSSHGSPWLLVGRELRADAPFFGTLGIACGIAQLASFHYFRSEFGSELLQEHIAFHSLLLLVIVLMVLRAVAAWYEKRSLERNFALETFIEHLRARAIAFASAGSMTTLGFAIVVAGSEAYYHALVFAIFALYLIAIAEVVANPWSKKGQSRLFALAWSTMIAVPLSFSLTAALKL